MKALVILQRADKQYLLFEVPSEKLPDITPNNVIGVAPNDYSFKLTDAVTAWVATLNPPPESP